MLRMKVNHYSIRVFVYSIVICSISASNNSISNILRVSKYGNKLNVYYSNSAGYYNITPTYSDGIYQDHKIVMWAEDIYPLAGNIRVVYFLDSLDESELKRLEGAVKPYKIAFTPLMPRRPVPQRPLYQKHGAHYVKTYDMIVALIVHVSIQSLILSFIIFIGIKYCSPRSQAINRL